MKVLGKANNRIQIIEFSIFVLSLHSGLRGKKTPILIVTFCHENRLNQCFLVLLEDIHQRFLKKVETKKIFKVEKFLVLMVWIFFKSILLGDYAINQCFHYLSIMQHLSFYRIWVLPDYADMRKSIRSFSLLL